MEDVLRVTFRNKSVYYKGYNRIMTPTKKGDKVFWGERTVERYPVRKIMGIEDERSELVRFSTQKE